MSFDVAFREGMWESCGQQKTFSFFVLSVPRRVFFDMVNLLLDDFWLIFFLPLLGLLHLNLTISSSMQKTGKRRDECFVAIFHCIGFRFIQYFLQVWHVSAFEIFARSFFSIPWGILFSNFFTLFHIYCFPRELNMERRRRAIVKYVCYVFGI